MLVWIFLLNTASVYSMLLSIRKLTSTPGLVLLVDGILELQLFFPKHPNAIVV